MVNLRVALDARFDAHALADARARAERAGYTLRRVDAPDEHLCAWIDWQFPASSWSSETRAGSAWIAMHGASIAGFAAFGARGLRFVWLRAHANDPTMGIFGPYGVAPDYRGTLVGELLLTAALCSLREHYAQALIPAVAGDALIGMYERRTGATVVDTFDLPQNRARAIILASGNGTNAQAVIEGAHDGRLPIEIAGVVVNHASAGVIARAHALHVPSTVVEWARGSQTRAAYDATLLAAIERLDPQLVLLLGWMHLVAPAFIDRFPNALNVHPAFLPFDGSAESVVLPDGSSMPAFRGARAPEATIAAHAAWSGVSVHGLSIEADRGAIAIRTPFALPPGCDLATLREALRPYEQAAVAAAIRHWSFER